MNKTQNDIHDYFLDLYDNGEINEELKSFGKKIDEINEKPGELNKDDFHPTQNDIRQFPQNTWLLHIKFKLKRPYHSRDERISESNNPILRDKLLGYPMVVPSTWKGNLRFAARKVKGENKDKIDRLFGPESDSDEEARKGRLYFYPTFFTCKTEEDVITPLSREKRTPVKGRSPIDMEVVPAGATGHFYLLYFPYRKVDEWNRAEVLEELKFIAEALERMFLHHGFSAKKTSGFGVIYEKFEDFSLWWDEKNQNRNRGYDKIKNFSTLRNEIERMVGGKK